MSKIIMQQGCNRVVDNNELLVDWSLLEACNWQCSYCFTHGKELSKFIPSLDQLKCAANNLYALNKSKYHLYLIGGEITIIPHFKDFIVYLNELFGDRGEIMLTTNGYRNWQYFDELAAASRNKLKITISIHTESAKLDNLVSIVENLSEKTALSFGLIYHLGRKEYAKEIFATLSEMKRRYRFGLGISPVLVPPLYTEINPRYTPEDLAWMEKGNQACKLIEKAKNTQPETCWDFVYSYSVQENGKVEQFNTPCTDKLLSDGLLNFKDMYCCQGVGYFHIQHTGECVGSRCGINNGKFGNFYEPGIQLYHENAFPYAVRCRLDNCVCTPHHILPKFRNSEDLAAFAQAKLGFSGLEE